MRLPRFNHVGVSTLCVAMGLLSGCSESDGSRQAGLEEQTASDASDGEPLKLRLVSGSKPSNEGVDLGQVVTKSFATAHLPTQIGPMRRGKIYFKQDIANTQPTSYTMATYTVKYPDHTRAQIKLSVSDAQGNVEDHFLSTFKLGEVVKEDASQKRTVRQFMRGEYFAKEEITRYPGGQGFNFGDDTTVELTNRRFNIRLQYFARVGTSDIPPMEDLWRTIDESHLARLFELPVKMLSVEEVDARLASAKAKSALPSIDVLLPASEVARISGYESVIDKEAAHKMPGTAARHYRAETGKNDFTGKPVRTSALAVVIARPGGYEAGKRTTENTPKWNMASIPDLGRDGYSRDYILKVYQSEMHHREVVFDHPRAYVELQLITRKNEPSVMSTMDQIIQAARVIAANLDKLP